MYRLLIHRYISIYNLVEIVLWMYLKNIKNKVHTALELCSVIVELADFFEITDCK